jgi:hypothetical protein
MERALSSDLSLKIDLSQAKCKDYPNPDFFFNTVVTRDRQEFADEQKEFCVGCPVIEECFNYALHVDVRGVWGGTSYQDRRTIRRQLNIIAEPLEFGDGIIPKRGESLERRTA